ncbi:ferredoxin [Clostridium thermosuccinogenes]|jgi:Na+-translocating ferredoxin:NAD+ oxidoreductase RNF subunit RnfB|uniref:Ferredoxin n=1 Tax=Clostridium thermosuccinogenes TaxID=84032 RepID=A0A2K2FMY3_9CLOT|nr:[Fe-Fe] hydrogenase large subunit C-terminal domain-containing protein [Pseudoclostridium thermosuccinogenes]AUS97831.1 ferredoxin [Pseudoclostridium thermosuccinogenes]PNU00127.1 ferredoxin [Pseudoclostridium thermosuccinogenes]PNU01452.1 ferredoxin [Pseudoclostridium thermosuccinogenes]
MGTYFHSVTLDEESCRGCTNCIKRCPTEAIRVRKGKARIINERCIDCGECIRICPYHAKKAISDPFGLIYAYKYRVAIPAPTLYGQFKANITRRQLLTALKMIGFDEVYEVAKGAEIVSAATRELLEKTDVKKPLISSACPAVVRLIQVRFPNLINNILRLDSPMEVTAKMAKEKISRDKGIRGEDIGVFFITPCAAKVTSIKAPYGKTSSYVNGAISIKDIYLKVLSKLDKAAGKAEDFDLAGYDGVRWANSGGESLALGTDKFLAVDGIHNVIAILDDVEDDRLEDVEFIEALACTGGCLGGPLTVENLYVAKNRFKRILDEMKADAVVKDSPEKYKDEVDVLGVIEHRPVMKLDDDIQKAMEMMANMKNIYAELPGLDCGACGAPSCKALAEDIVRGNADETDCIFKLREKVRNLAAQMIELEDKMPPVMDRVRKKNR